MADFLASHGFRVETGVYDLPTSFKAVYANNYPQVSIGFCAEYDALPEIGHACGHNLIAISSIAAAVICSKMMSQLNLNGQIIVYGTPGEETLGGKILMMEKGAFHDLDIALMGHPGNINTLFGKWLSLAVLNVEYFGKAAHAAASPWEGINALDAAVLAYQSIGLLRQQTLPNNRIHGVIHHGGTRPNIIPDYTKLEFYLRSDTIQDLKILKEKTYQCLHGAAQSTGCSVKIQEDPVFAHVKHNETLLRVYEKYMKQLGAEFVPEMVQPTLVLGSTDMGNVTQVVPGFHPVFDIGARGFTIHSREFAEMAQSEEAHERTLTFITSLVLTTLDILSDPQLLARVKKEFQSSTC